jgi:hypothetical protein
MFTLVFTHSKLFFSVNYFDTVAIMVASGTGSSIINSFMVPSYFQLPLSSYQINYGTSLC